MLYTYEVFTSLTHGVGICCFCVHRYDDVQNETVTYYNSSLSNLFVCVFLTYVILLYIKLS